MISQFLKDDMSGKYSNSKLISLITALNANAVVIYGMYKGFDLYAVSVLAGSLLGLVFTGRSILTWSKSVNTNETISKSVTKNK